MYLELNKLIRFDLTFTMFCEHLSVLYVQWGIKYSVFNAGTVLNGLLVLEEGGEVYSRERSLCQDFGGWSWR